MSILINPENFPQTKALMGALAEKFGKGYEVIHLRDDSDETMTVLSPEASRDFLTRRAAERIVRDPAVLEKLSTHLKEQPEDWD